MKKKNSQSTAFTSQHFIRVGTMLKPKVDARLLSLHTEIYLSFKLKNRAPIFSLISFNVIQDTEFTNSIDHE